MLGVNIHAWVKPIQAPHRTEIITLKVLYTVWQIQWHMKNKRSLSQAILSSLRHCKPVKMPLTDETSGQIPPNITKEWKKESLKSQPD